MLNFDHFAYNSASLPADEFERKKFFKQLEQQFDEEVKNSEHAQTYFRKYTLSNIDSFIQSYASRKAHLAQCYTYYADEYHEKEISELNFQGIAESMLEAILQKKLFDMQLLWRAGQLEIDGISISYDFVFWGDHILSCPFIPPVEKNELELIKEFLMRFDENRGVDEYCNWQDYDELTEKDENGLMPELPDWYEFYDLRMGTGVLLNLPNLKGEKEEYYLSLFREDLQTDYPPQTDQAQKPILFTGTQELFDFCNYFETDKYFIALFKYYKYHYLKENRRPNYEDIDSAIRLLYNADRPIHCHAHLNWDAAILRAANEYTNTKIVEMLDFVYQEYRMMKDLGISGCETREEIEEAYSNDCIVDSYRVNIMKGRKLNGEPEDFDY